MSTDAQCRLSDLRSPDLSEIDRSAARYLRAIAKLSASGADRVSTGEFRSHLGVAAASVSGMVT